MESALVCLLSAFLLLLWTAAHNRPGNFNIVPEIKAGAELITKGPYRFIRHPMYTAVVLIGLSALLYGFVWWKIIVFFILILVLFAKARREERLWSESKSGYKKYKARSKMFIPFVF